ncbi:MAG: hypothetical protein RL701_7045 [Pseudomonadota bacterium]|jgi:hypothetical protein
MVSDSFRGVPVDVIADSGLPFSDTYTECQQSDGGALRGVIDFNFRKHPSLRIAMISRTEDEVMRLFYSGGTNNCQNFETLDPVTLVLGHLIDPTNMYPATMYSDAVADARDRLAARYAFASFVIGAPNQNYHQIMFRPDFYTLTRNSITPAQFVTDFIRGKLYQVAP